MATAKTTTKTTPVVAEAVLDTVVVTFREKELHVLSTVEWPFDALEAFETGRVATFLSMVLVGNGYADLKATKPKVGDLTELVEDIQKALGITGN